MRDIRLLDHLVLPTASLEIARRRLTAVGFTVAPQGIHPFGTANCCVYFEDDTFLEPLAIVDAQIAANASGNVFVSDYRRYVDAAGEEGLSALVVGTRDADADHRRFEEAGSSAGPILTFSRPVVDPSGKSDVATFKLAFAKAPGLPLALIFACERVGVPKVDRAALQAHLNGVTRILEVIVPSNDPFATAARVAETLGVPRDRYDDATIPLSNAAVVAMERDTFEHAFGYSAPLQDRLAAIVFGVQGLARTVRWLEEGRIRHEIRSNGDVVIPSSPGQGAVFIFREMP